jgi:hypothetical protein
MRASPDISHYLCTIEQVWATICSVFCGRAALWRLKTRGSAGTFPVLRAQRTKAVSVGLG